MCVANRALLQHGERSMFRTRRARGARGQRLRLFHSMHRPAGYGHQAPDPQCYLLQFGVMAQVRCSS